MKLARQQGCCSSSDCVINFEDRADLGRRRLLLLRRVSAVCSVVTCAAALVLLLPVVPVADVTADRVAWAAAVWGLPRLLQYARAAMATRRITLPLLVAVALVVIAAVGLPIVAALSVAVVLVVDLLRQPNARQAPQDSAAAGTAQLRQA